MPSDNNGTGESSKKVSEDAMKKLNDAFSSYFDENKSTDKEKQLSEKESLLELVQAEILEKQKEMLEASSDEHLPEVTDETAQDDMVSSEDESKDFTDKLNEVRTPDVLSNVFNDVQFQSVDIEVEEVEQVVKVEEEKAFSEKLDGILKKKTSEPNIVSAPITENKKVNIEKPAVKQIPSEKVQISKTNPNDDVFVSRAFVKKQSHPVKELPKKDTSFVKESEKPLSSEVTVQKKDPESVKAELKKNIEKTKLKPKSASEPKEKPSSDLQPKAAISPSSKKVDFTIPGGEAKIALLYNKDHVSHDAAALSSHTNEKPERLIKAMWYLEKNKVFTDGTCTLIEDFEMATEEDLLRVHEESHVSFVRSYSAAGGGFLGDSTYMSSASYNIAKKAAGGAIKAGDLLMAKEYTHAFVMTRPPGHHASSKKYGGFCLFNNAAVLARYLQQKKNVGRVLILDWDAHAGDGTMEIFYDDPTVMVISMHRDPHTFYPRKGFSDQDGESSGKGYTMNVEMPEGAGNEEYELTFEEVVLPLIEHYSPEFLIVSAGFDAHYYEKSIGLSLDSDGYHYMTTRLLSVFGGPIVFLMEGGYHDFNGQLCHTVLSALHRRPNPIKDKQELSSYKQNLRKQIYVEMQKKVEESKKKNPVLCSQGSE